MPDFMNVDLDYPQAGWEDTLDYVLDAVKAERPDFLLVAGDLVMGHWHGRQASPPSRAGASRAAVGSASVAKAPAARSSIAHYAERYYGTWKARMTAHELKWYPAIGDHELGDNPWRYPQALDNVAAYKRAFRLHLGMPENGPAELQGTAFYWVPKRVLFIAVDVFEPGTSNQGQIRPGVTGKQLAWLRHVIDTHPNVEHVIVMGHAPCIGPVRQWRSSGLMITGGRDSEFWHTLADRGIGLYLCGEVHAITCTARDGVQQIAHGGLIGYNTRTNYVVVDVFPNRVELTIKEIDLVPSGEKLWQPGTNRPLERVDIRPESKPRGFIPVGTETIDTRTRPHTFRAQRGYFLNQFDTSTTRGRPVFVNGGKALPRINLDGTVTK